VDDILAAIREALDKATPGPWRLTKDRKRIIQTHHITRDVWTIPRVEADVDLIAHAPEWLAELLAHVARVTVERDALVKRWEALRDWVPVSDYRSVDPNSLYAKIRELEIQYDHR
jgi:hypothetical protein